jgi:phosphoserine aminotransferase
LETELYHSMSDLLSVPAFYLIQFLCVGGMFSIDFFLFSLEATKNNFQNYLKFQTLKERRLSQSCLQEYMLEMMASNEQNMKL